MGAKQKTSGSTMSMGESMGMGRAARMAQAKAKGFLKTISEPFGLYFQQPSSNFCLDWQLQTPLGVLSFCVGSIYD